MDFESVGRRRWYTQANRNGRSPFYARRNTRDAASGKRSYEFLHTAILGSLWGDHVNGNGLDNRRKNLRLATNLENSRAFKRGTKHKTSRFRGVSWHKMGRKWAANLAPDNNRHLGLFDSEINAAIAWDTAALAFGFFDSALNFPPARSEDFEVLPSSK